MAIQGFLNQQYGEGSYLTAYDINWSKTINVSPQSDFASSASVLKDSGVSHSCLSHGTGGVSLGTIQLPEDILPSGYDSAFMFGPVVKMPGEDKHSLPYELAPLLPVVQMFADFEYSQSEYARDKIAVLNFRLLTLDEERAQAGEDFHLHGYTRVERGGSLQEGFLGLGTPEDQVDVFDRFVTPHVLHHECFISNVLPTRYQVAPCESALPIKNGRQIRLSRREDVDKIVSRVADPHELIAGDTAMWHRAQSVTSSDAGQKRYFASLTYFSTHQVQQKLGAPNFSFE
ncbi:MAG: hypothetical protein ACPG05_04325 [Bdellovibrionales bacterium]